MTVPASKIKSLCTSAEVALVRASRKPELEKHLANELKRLAAQARKLFDKWQGQGRTQARERGRQVGVSAKAANTQLKTQIFRDALDAFEAQLAKLDKNAGAKGGKPAKTKKTRAAEHRQTRAAVRKGMTAALDLTNMDRASRAAKPASKKVAAKKVVAKKVVVKKAPPKPAAVAAASLLEPSPAPAKPVGKPRRSKPALAQPVLHTSVLSPEKQLRAATMAKQVRITKSGKSTRVRGHVTARGKRDQARRDTRNASR